MASDSCPELARELASEADLELLGAEDVILPYGLATGRDPGSERQGARGGRGGGGGTGALPEQWSKC